MNPQIKFSHNYLKFGSLLMPFTARLVGIALVDSEKLTGAFIDYETAFRREDGSIEYYKLPKGKLIMLVFFAENRNVFTTLRPYTEDKLRYYATCTGGKVVRGCATPYIHMKAYFKRN